jgi:hypothetical protein
MATFFEAKQPSTPINIPNNKSNNISDSISIPRPNMNINDNIMVYDTINDDVNNYEKDIPYALKENFFDPNKSSPPNFWSCRLLERMNHY